MEQKDIDIYEILNGMPDGTQLYTPMCGNVELTSVEEDKEILRAIWTENKYGGYSFDKHGKWTKGGEVLLFPSKEMRDWSKFFKKGDVLEYVGDEKVQGTCTFEKYDDETKTRFLGRFVKEKEALYYKRPSILLTADWVKSDDPSGYIRFVEERLCGKLNLETLEIEKPAFKPFDKVLVRNEERSKWQPAFFVRDRGEETIFKYKVLSIQSGRVEGFLHCIPFDGNEDIAFTDYD